MLGLQSLPGESEIEKLRELKRMEVLFFNKYIWCQWISNVFHCSESEVEQKLQHHVSIFQIQRRIEEERKTAAEREQKRREENRKKDEQKKAEIEKERVRLEKLSLHLKLKPDTKDSAVIDSGWKPMEVDGSKTKVEDPMLQQINIIRGYVKQAKQAQKYDEVRMLEENLKDLQQEWWRQQNAAKKYSS